MRTTFRRIPPADPYNIPPTTERELAELIAASPLPMPTQPVRLAFLDDDDLPRPRVYRKPDLWLARRATLRANIRRAERTIADAEARIAELQALQRSGRYVPAVHGDLPANSLKRVKAILADAVRRRDHWAEQLVQHEAQRR